MSGREAPNARQALRTPIWFAPMEGLTDAVFRRAHFELFGGAERYYMPFVSLNQNLSLNGRDKHNVLPEYNRGVPCVPQVLTKEAYQFLWAADLLRDLGYDEVNLNAGCPSGTVTAKGKGAGLLRDADGLDRLLEEICSKSPLPVSVKTRVGFENTGEWEKLLHIYARYPLKCVIVHPRSCRDGYAPGTLDFACWQAAAETLGERAVYNGDLFSVADLERIASLTGREGPLMLGRGLVAQPALAREIAGGEKLKKEELAGFHRVLGEGWRQLYDENVTFMKLRVVMKHTALCFENAGKAEKKIRHAKRPEELFEAEKMLFDKCELKREPCFIPDELRENL